MDVGIFKALPATIMTAMVSPMARPMPRIIAVMMPLEAAGSTTRRTVCQLVAPRAMEPSR